MLCFRTSRSFYRGNSQQLRALLLALRIQGKNDTRVRSVYSLHLNVFFSIIFAELKTCDWSCDVHYRVHEEATEMEKKYHKVREDFATKVIPNRRCMVPTRIGKPGKTGEHFVVREKSGNFVKIGKVGKFYLKYWKIRKNYAGKLKKKHWIIQRNMVPYLIKIRLLKNTGKLRKILGTMWMTRCDSVLCTGWVCKVISLCRPSHKI